MSRSTQSRTLGRDASIAPSPGPAPGISQENITQRVRARAYEIFVGRLRDGGGGDAVADWLQAEREIIKDATQRAGRAAEARTVVRSDRLLSNGH